MGRAAVSRPTNRGFTLVELLVVILIIALLAGMVIPRFLSNDQRVFEQTVAEVNDMLTMFAQRESLSRQTVGLHYDESRHRLSVIVYDVDPISPNRYAEWRHDNFIRPVRLPPFVELLDVLADQASVDIARWPLATRPGQERQWIELLLAGPESTVSIVLSPYAVSPRVVYHDRENPGMVQPIDLNRMGQSREIW